MGSSDSEVVEMVEEITKDNNESAVIKKVVPSAWRQLFIFFIPFIFTFVIFCIRSGVLSLLQNWLDDKKYSYGVSWAFTVPAIIGEGAFTALVLFVLVKKLDAILPTGNFDDTDHPKKESLGIIPPAHVFTFTLVNVIIGVILIYTPVFAKNMGAKSIELEMRHDSQVYQTPAAIYYICSESILQSTIEIIFFFMVFLHRLVRAFNDKASKGKTPEAVQWKPLMGAILLTVIFWTLHRAFYRILDPQTRLDLISYYILRDVVLGIAYSFLALAVGGRFWYIFVMRAVFRYSEHVIAWKLPIPTEDQNLPNFGTQIISTIMDIFSDTTDDSDAELLDPILPLFKKWRDVVYSAPMYLSTQYEEKGFAQWNLLITIAVHLIIFLYSLLAIRGLKDGLFLGSFSPVSINQDADIDDMSDMSDDDTDFEAEYSTSGYSSSEQSHTSEVSQSESDHQNEVVIQDADSASEDESRTEETDAAPPTPGKIEIKE